MTQTTPSRSPSSIYSTRQEDKYNPYQSFTTESILRRRNSEPSLTIDVDPFEKLQNVIRKVKQIVPSFLLQVFAAAC